MVRRIAAVVACLALMGSVFAPRSAEALTGSWIAYPGSSVLYQTVIQQPINADGTSSFKSNGNAVIPVKFQLLAGQGPFRFESIFSDNPAQTANDFSFLSFTPGSPTTFSQINSLKSTYAFLQGNCGGGALRWSVRVDIGNDGDASNDKSVFIYYGDHPNFTDCTTTNQSGLNMINRPDLRYDTSQAGGTFYDSYANAVALVGGLPVVRVSLVLDGGWLGDQRVALTSATVNDNTYIVPIASALAPTCNLPSAIIKVTKISGSMSGPVNEPETVQPADNNMNFRVVDCKYLYNLATSSLSGPGRYKIEAVVVGVLASGAAHFDLR